VKIIALVCGLLSGLFGALAALALLKGSKPVPWEIQSSKGQSEAEREFRAAAMRWNKVGVALLVAAFAMSAAASVAGYCE
jgi:hypothetical protein